jgi:hypothetical protein
MKCRMCGRDFGKEGIGEKIDHKIAKAHEIGLCSNCWYDTTDNDANKTVPKVRNDGWNFSNTFTTIEYLVTCIECDEHNPIGYYGYLWFATQDGREHVLSRRHKLVTKMF